MSMGTAECYNVIIKIGDKDKRITSETAVIANSKWCPVKVKS